MNELRNTLGLISFVMLKLSILGFIGFGISSTRIFNRFIIDEDEELEKTHWWYHRRALFVCGILAFLGCLLGTVAIFLPDT